MLKKAIAILGFIASTANAAMWSERLHTDSFDPNNNQTVYSILSDNTANFKFPYNGGSTLAISLHKFNKDNHRGVRLLISKGQFSCGFDGCYVEYKVNNGPVKTIKMYRDNDGSSDIIKTSGDSARQFGRDVINAKKIEIRVNFFQEGSRDFVFNPTN